MSGFESEMFILDSNGKVDHSNTLVAKAKKKQPDLIILDVMMPEIDGYEVCKKLKENYKNSNNIALHWGLI